jgi:hypothetical protein
VINSEQIVDILCESVYFVSLEACRRNEPSLFAIAVHSDCWIDVSGIDEVLDCELEIHARGDPSDPPQGK